MCERLIHAGNRLAVTPCTSAMAATHAPGSAHATTSASLRSVRYTCRPSSLVRDTSYARTTTTVVLIIWCPPTCYVDAYSPTPNPTGLQRYKSGAYGITACRPARQHQRQNRACLRKCRRPRAALSPRLGEIFYFSSDRTVALTIQSNRLSIVRRFSCFFSLTNAK